MIARRDSGSRPDWAVVRERREADAARRHRGRTLDPRIVVHPFSIQAQDGDTIPLYLFRRSGPSEPGPMGLFMHGGGFILGSTHLYQHEIARYVLESGVPMLSVDYRRAGEVHHPVPIDDCYAALTYLIRHAGRLSVDPKRIVLVGESAGGGLAAALAIRARDENVHVAKQVLVYPMLDDRTIGGADFPDAGAITWTFEENAVGWSALLDTYFGQPDVHPTAAPARLIDFSGLAPAYVEVGENDIFCQEALEYVRRLHRAGVSAELHVHPAAAHGFDRDASHPATERAWTDRGRAVASTGV